MADKPILLPLITSSPMSSPTNPDLQGADAPETLTVQLDTLGGDIYLVPLSVEAARQLLLGLMLWPPAIEALKSGSAPNRKLDN